MTTHNTEPKPGEGQAVTKKPQITRVASYGIVRSDSRILLCRLSAEVPEKQGWWTLPGGGIEFGEHPEEGMIREVLEETGFLVRPTGLLGIDSITLDGEADSRHGIRIIFSTQVVGGSMKDEAEGTTDKCEWHPIADVAELQVVELVEEALLMLHGQGT